MKRPAALLALALSLALSGSSAAQQIQRCEDARGKITYSNADCPEGTKPVRSVQSAPPPSPEAQQAAHDEAARDAQTAWHLPDQRRSEQTAVVQQQQQREPIAPTFRGKSSRCSECATCWSIAPITRSTT
jgi:hypothetical protein